MLQTNRKYQKNVYCLRLSSNLSIHCGISHFTAVCLITWPINASEAGGGLAFIETSLLFSFTGLVKRAGGGGGGGGLQHFEMWWLENT